MHSPGRQIRLGMAALAYLVGMFILTHAPINSLLSDSISWGVADWDTEWEFDKYAHIAAYAILAALFTALPLVRFRSESDDAGHLEIIGEAEICQLGIIAALLACVGLLDEVTQPMFGRSFGVDDWLADLVGIAVGQAIAIAICMCVHRAKSEFNPID